MEILGVRIDNLTKEEALKKALELLEEGKKHYAVTINPEFIVKAKQDREFKEVLNNASLNLADGVGLIWAASFLGSNLKERVTGTDFVYDLAKLAMEKGFTLYLLGGEEGVANLAAAKLKTMFPTLKILGVSSGDPDKIPLDLLEKGAAVLLVAYGHPKQEKWIVKNLPELKVKLAVGVGGALDYISGKTRRAPKWLRDWGLEWLFRLIYEPWRIKRQLALPYFGFLVLKEKLLK